MSAYSDAVYAAQAALLVRRQSLPKLSPIEERSTAKSNVSESPLTAVFINALPAHLGWNSTTVSRHLRCRQNHKTTKDSPEFVPQHVPTESPENLIPKTVRHYPDIGIAALNNKRVPQYQLWLACRLFDVPGRGWIATRVVQQQFAEKDAPLRLFGNRRLRQVLQAGNGRFWTWDKKQQRLWLVGVSRIAEQLQVRRLTGSPVLLPVTVLTAGIGTFKAHLYAAWHSGRRTSNPISRDTQQKLLGIPGRTQRHYEQKTAVTVITNLAVGAPYTAENIETHTWRHGGAVFQFTDKQGRLGKPNGRYLAWQLPNLYFGPHQKAALGRQRHINRQLIGLVHKGAQGNIEPRFTRRYFPHGADAAQAVQTKQCQEGYWPLKQKQRLQIWSLFLHN